MQSSEFNEKILSLIVELRESYDFNYLSSPEFSNLCELADIERIVYTVTIPVNKIHRKEEIHSDVLFSSGKDFDEDHSLTTTFRNQTMNTIIHTKLYWNTKTEPDQERLNAYNAFGSFLYMFLSRARMNSVMLNVINKDFLTNLPSMDFIEKKYDREISSFGKTNEYAVIFVNIQNMKFYNKMYGSHMGDAVIKAFAGIIQNLCNEDEFITRPGGDNFVLAIRKERLDFIIEKLENIELPLIEGMQEKHRNISTWRGISLDVPPKLPFGARIYQASVALNIAKNTFHQKVIIFTEEIERASNWAKQIIANFSNTLQNQEYIPFYQPKVHIQTGNIVGLESLVRWKKGNEILPPSAFVSILESYDLVPMLDLYMLDKICHDLRNWIDAGIKPPRVSCNLSRKNLYDKNIVKKVLDIINKYNIPVSYIEIEILETTNINETELLISMTKELKSQGIRVSMDDFGTGYSSLSLLKDVNADIAKIDKTFVDDCINDKRTFILIKNMIQLAKELNMEIIAEGVETPEQAKFLMNMGCYNAQGYLYSKPIPYEAITPCLKEGKYKLKLN